MKIIRYFLLFNVLVFYAAQAQNKRIDSLQQVRQGIKSNDAKAIKQKVDVLTELCWELNESDPKKALGFGKEALLLAKTNKYTQGEAVALKNIGVLYQYQGNYPQALENYLQSLKIFEQIKDESGIANVLNNIGIVYRNQGNNKKALTYFVRVQKIDEANGDQTGLASILNNLGSIYYQEDNFEKAQEYFEKSLKIEESLKDDAGISISYNNLGLVALAEKKVEKAIDYYTKALKLDEKAGNKTSASGTLNNIAYAYQTQDKLKKALSYALKGYQLAEEVNSQELVMQLSETLMTIYEGLKDFEKAYEYQTYHLFAKEEVFNEANTKKVSNLQSAYELEKKQAEVALLKANEERSKAESARRQSIIIFTLMIIIILAIGIVGLYVSNQRRKRVNGVLRKQRNVLREKNEEINQQKEEILAQRDAIEERNNEIVAKNQDIESSIQYAKRIQEAILPNKDEMKQALPQHFIYYRPRDIVSGDFYWFAKTEPLPLYADSPDFQGNKLLKGFENEKLILAAVDCTGHGVPGAFMSAIGDSLLNHIVFDRRLHEPASILKALQDGVRKALRQDEIENKDGMDMGLVVIDMEKKELTFAGARNSLWIIQNSEMTEIRGDTVSIGGWQPNQHHQFTTHTFPLDIPTSIYMASDGYQDQFGGPKGKKFMRRKLRELFKEIYHKPMEEQYRIIDTTMKEWMSFPSADAAQQEQVDDMLVVGVRFQPVKERMSFRRKTDFSKHV
ncbi:hypothetical protein BKI52_41635 [marine bacterium AO1-C]|nr:hypothetical protein BKI52_41635 [marine bacterium AO1-C]